MLCFHIISYGPDNYTAKIEVNPDSQKQPSFRGGLFSLRIGVHKKCTCITLAWEQLLSDFLLLGYPVKW